MFPKFLKDFDYGIYRRGRGAVLDFETTNSDKGSALNSTNRVVAWVLYDIEGDRIYQEYISGDSESLKYLLDLIQKFDFLICHHAKFELQWLYRCGCLPGSVLVYDTLLAEYVIAGNRRVSLDLDSVAVRYGISGKESVVKKLISGGVCPSTIPEKRLMNYCVQDVRITAQVYQAQLHLMDPELLPVVFTRCLTCMCLADIESVGMKLDVSAVKEAYVAELSKSRKLLGTLDELTGGINPKSPKQVAEFLYDNLGFDELRDRNGVPIRTPAGGRRTDEATIRSLKARDSRQRAFVASIRAYTPVKKRLETLTKLNECANSDGILKASFNQSIARTHRLTSSGSRFKVQFQNIDRDFKRLFVQRAPGYSIGEADAPQLEFRTAGFLGQDPQAMADITNKFDVHTYTASVIHKMPMEKITKAQRTDAKPFTFKPLYGGNSGSVEQKAYYAAFRAKYDRIYNTQKDWTYTVLRDKKLRTASGLIFYWPEVKADPHTGYIHGTTEIFNYPVQSLATAEIIPISLIYLWYRLQGSQSFIVNTVHDSLICEIAEHDRGLWEQSVKAAFTSDVYLYLKRVYNINFNIKLGVGYHSGLFWGDGDEHLFELEPEL